MLYLVWFGLLFTLVGAFGCAIPGSQPLGVETLAVGLFTSLVALVGRSIISLRIAGMRATVVAPMLLIVVVIIKFVPWTPGAAPTSEALLTCGLLLVIPLALLCLLARSEYHYRRLRERQVLLTFDLTGSVNKSDCS